MKQRFSKVIALVMALCLVLQLGTVSAFAVTPDEKPYDSVSIYGDSLCLGFDAAAAVDAMDPLTFDIRSNASENKYPHSYPSVLAEKLGLSPTEDLRNYGICAAWSNDMYDMLTDIFWQYSYDYSTGPYDENTTFILPEDFTARRNEVDTTAEGYDVADPSTWVYTDAMTEDNHHVKEDYTIPAGTEIKVAYLVSSPWYGDYYQLNDAITQQYMYCTRDSYDDNGNLMDNNGDGKIDQFDITFYPMVQKEVVDNSWGFPMTYKVWAPDTDTYADTLGEAIACPLFTGYGFYKLDTDQHIQNDDLLLLAIGGNDIYHSMIDTGTFMSGDTSVMGQIVSLLSMALMTNGSSITGILEEDMYTSMIEQILNKNAGSMPMMLSETAEAPAAEGGFDLGDFDLGDFDLEGAGAAGILSVLAGMTTVLGLEDCLNYYSKDNVNAYMADMIANYKDSYRKCVEYMVANKKDDAPLVLVGNYNPFGMVNYLEMLSAALQDGELAAHLGEDGAALLTLLQGILGTPDAYAEIENMTEAELMAAAETTQNELSGILDQLSQMTGDLTDEQVDRLFNDLSFPLSVMVIGNGLSDVYSEMNGFLADLANEYANDKVVYVDISGAPANNRYDPHPTAKGHKWIADRLYEAVVPTVNAAVSCCGTGSGTISPEGTSMYRLFDNAEYTITPDEGSKISAIFVDGRLLNPCEYKDVYASGTYVFEDLTKAHCILVQFDKTCCPTVTKYSVEVVGSYAGDASGSGLYKPGTVVTIDAGTQDGYEFCGWLCDGVELADASSAQTSFVMPSNNVKVVATWKLIEDPVDPVDPEPVMNVISFQTNGGSPVADATFEEGTILGLDAFVTEKDGYKFVGWCTDEELTNVVTDITLNGDITLYAKWEKIEAPVNTDDVDDNNTTETVDTDVVDDTNPTTGDHSNMGLWIALMGVAVIGTAGVFVFKKKEQRDN